MNNKVSIGIIIILGLLCAFLGYKVSQKSDIIADRDTQVEEISEDRGRIELELEKMKFSYDTLRTDNEVLSQELLAQREQVESLLKKVKNKDYDLYKIKKEAETLRDIMKGYVYTIDSLNTLNIAQREEISGLRTDLGRVQNQKNQLKNQYEELEGKLEAGAVLQASGVSSTAIRLKNSGKQVDTDRASKTEMIKTCFTLTKNPLSPAGNKNLYLRIVAPNGSVLPSVSGEASRLFEGELQNYSIRREVNYNNEETDVCVFYTVINPEAIPKGNYTVIIYEQEHKIGQTSLSLR
ncbi:MAG: hypothetical protein AB8B53_14895 [Flavobacteriales bacterium]